MRWLFPRTNVIADFDSLRANSSNLPRVEIDTDKAGPRQTNGTKARPILEPFTIHVHTREGGL